MPIDAFLANKGRAEPLAELVQQLSYSIAKAEQHLAALVAAGWDPAETAEMKQLDADLDEQSAARADARDASRGATAREQAAVAEVKKHKRSLDNVLPTVLRKKPVDDVTIKSFAVGGRLGRNTGEISAWLGRIAGALVKLDAPLARYFKGGKPSEIFARLKQTLDEANTAQETKLADLPAETQAIYEKKGRAVQLIEDLNSVAKNAFDGDAAVMGTFNKDILLRGRKKGKAGKDEEKVEEAGGG